MSIQRPQPVGSMADEPPEVIWNVLVEVEFDPALSSAEIDALQPELWDRLNDVAHETLGPCAQQPASVQITAVNGRGETTPVFPMVAGKRHFTCNLDIEEEVERKCADTDLTNLAFDARGHAYELGVSIDYQRRPEFDGVRRAWAPRPKAAVRPRRKAAA